MRLALGVLNATSNLWELRMEFAWPFIWRSTTNILGGGRAVYSTLVMARQTNNPPESEYFFFIP